MPRRDHRARRRSWIVVLVAAGAIGACLGQTGDAPATPEPALPVYLDGIDLSLPAQEAFREWPAAALRERPYWMPWGGLSFRRAVLFDRPIVFVLTVPWNRLAQRMDEETLTDPEVLFAMNEGFLGIQVNADRRPDIRERYQTGTWPVVALLLPDGIPMLSKANASARPLPITAGLVNPAGMKFILEEGRVYYDLRKPMLEQVGDRWAASEGGFDPAAGAVDGAASDRLTRWLMANADREDGGFGLAPKFVLPWLMEYAALREARALPALMPQARLSVEKMVSGPLFDRRDGGVHRIAAEPDWKGIQFEKMLDKNAFLMRELVTALRLDDDPELRSALSRTAAFVMGVLGRDGGGFYHAQYADPGSRGGGGYWLEPASPDRTAPPVDRLMLSGTNALAGATLLRVGALLDDDTIADAGRQALDIVLEHGYERARGAVHVMETPASQRRYLETQADVALGLLDAHESTGDARYLETARDIVDFAVANLGDPGIGPLRDHLAGAAPLGILGNPRRPLKPNVRLARAMIRLTLLGQGDGYRDRAASILEAFAGDLTTYRMLGVEAGVAIEEWIAEPLVITIEGPPGAPTVAALRRAALNQSSGWAIVRTGTAVDAAPIGARLSWRGSEVRVARPEDLGREANALLGIGAGALR